MNFRLATPSVLVDLNAVHELAYIRASAGLHIGAMARHRSVERSTDVASKAPLLAMALPWLAHAAIRTRGTIGGSLAHADPAAELPAVMLALRATFTLTRAEGTRTVPAADFFTGLFSTAIEPGELLTEIAIPPPPAGASCAFDEFSRRHGDFALAGAAAVVALDAHGRCSTVEIGLLSLADRPVLGRHAAEIQIGERPTAAAIRAAADAAADHDIDPTSDIHASSRYRRRLAAVLTRRVLERAFHSLEPA
jgi:CO/xanthine dehydrogenase FAD-binding subunit